MMVEVLVLWVGMEERVDNERCQRFAMAVSSPKSEFIVSLASTAMDYFW